MLRQKAGFNPSGFVGLTVLSVIAGWVGIGMSTASRAGEDFAVWVFVHGWLQRGESLYADVWDHKDFGFFFFNSLFFELGSTSGLVAGGLFWTGLFGCGVFVSASRKLNVKAALAVALITSMIYVLSPTYLGAYTENHAITIAVLAVALLPRMPAIAGVLLAISTSVKVSGLVITLFVFVILLVGSHWETHERRAAHRLIRRLVLSYTLGLLAIGILAVALGALSGWLEVISFNIEYSSIRRADRPSLFSPRALLSYLTGDTETRFFLSVLLSTTFLLFVVRNRTGTTVAPEQVSQMETSLEKHEQLVGIGLTLGAIAGVLAQSPARPHHFGYLVGAILYLASSSLARILATGIAVTVRLKIFVGFMVTLLSITVASFSIREDGPSWPTNNLAKWKSLEDGKLQFRFEESPDVQKSLVFLNYGGLAIDFETLPPLARIGCRFFYNLPHLMPRYKDEMLSCLRNDVDFVFVGLQKPLDSSILVIARGILESRYVQCDSPQVTTEVWIKPPNKCPTITVTG